MAKETKRLDHSEQSADIQSGTEPQTSKILLGLALQPLQMPLFVDPDNALGADEHFVTKTFGTVKPLMQAVADAAVAMVHLDGQFTVHLKQTATSALVSLQLVIAKRGHFTTQDERARMELAAALATRLSDAMTRVASESALIRAGEELHDLVLEQVAFIKLKGIPLTFSFGVFTEPIEDTSTLAMTVVHMRKRSTFLQGDKPVELNIKGAIKVSQGGERVRIGRVDGDRAVNATIEHGDPLAYEAHAVAAGGIASFVVEKATSSCKAAPEIERHSFKLLAVNVEDSTIATHLRLLVNAANELLDRFKRQPSPKE